ncbi:MAG TPA: response regulator [Spirochaetia bacterium]
MTASLPVREAHRAPNGTVTRRLLIVEDDPDTAELLRTILNDERIDISVERTGLRGVERAWAWKPDVIVLDHMLPELSGFDIFLELRKACFSPRIILVSAHAEPGLLAFAKTLGAFACVRKPLDRKLRTTVFEALGFGAGGD